MSKCNHTVKNVAIHSDNRVCSYQLDLVDCPQCVWRMVDNLRDEVEWLKALIEMHIRSVHADGDSEIASVQYESLLAGIAKAVDDYRSMAAKVPVLQKKAESEYQRGLEEGRSCQAILEIQGRERFMDGLVCAKCGSDKLKLLPIAAGVAGEGK